MRAVLFQLLHFIDKVSTTSFFTFQDQFCVRMGRHQLICISFVFLLITFLEFRNQISFEELTEEEKQDMENLMVTTNQQTIEILKSAEESKKKIDSSVDSLLNIFNQKVNDPM